MRNQEPEFWEYTGPDPVMKLVTQLANELGKTPQQIADDLDKAQDAGLIVVTDQGEIIATLPDGES